MLEAAGLSQAECARRLGVSKPLVCLWLSGERLPGIEACITIHGQAGPALHRRHLAWYKKQQKLTPVWTFSERLPEGVTPEAAREKCVAALASLVGEGTK